MWMFSRKCVLDREWVRAVPGVYDEQHGGPCGGKGVSEGERPRRWDQCRAGLDGVWPVVHGDTGFYSENPWEGSEQTWDRSRFVCYPPPPVLRC